MLIVAAIIFIFAMLFIFVDKWFDNAEMDLTLVIRILVFTSAMLIGLNVYLKP